MLTLAADRPLHARACLPESRDEIPELVDALLGPARAQRVRLVAFVVYTGDALLARAVARSLLRAFGQSGIDVLEALRADDGRWYPLVGRRPGVPEWGVPYDLSAHPFVAQAVVDGRVILGSREELRATLDGDPARIAPVVAALAELAGDPRPWREEATWVAGLVEQHLRDGTAPDDREVARLLRGILLGRVRDAAWARMTRESAPGHVRLWSDVVRRSPSPLVAAPAAVLALAAWQAGQGALAWCALDRGEEGDQPCSLADLVTDVLAQAIPPTAWSPADVVRP